MEIIKRTLGKTGAEVTILGLGGEGVLRTYGQNTETYSLINRAIDLGINYFESARAYSDCEVYYGNALKERRKDIFLTGKSHARTKKEAMFHLHETLSNMKTGHLDLWQIHDVRTSEDIEQIFGPGGAIEAFVEAKEKGFARFIGVTGHHDPLIIKKCIELFDFDTVLIPVNPAECQYKNFVAELAPLANKKGLGIIGMKVYLRGFALKVPEVTTLEPFFRFALSQTLSTVVIGCDTLEQVEENVKFAASFSPMSTDEMQSLENVVSPYARELMYYKS